ncbi:hypothetical protein [Actinacidiphila sp. ITFR-21]|uniref:hypothetical protein n=1 Tax=Actinacidiphila sp. ITFR-21 TaxID=3075199 RepID=UPI0037D9A67D
MRIIACSQAARLQRFQVESASSLFGMMCALTVPASSAFLMSGAIRVGMRVIVSVAGMGALAGDRACEATAVSASAV